MAPNKSSALIGTNGHFGVTLALMQTLRVSRSHQFDSESVILDFLRATKGPGQLIHCIGDVHVGRTKALDNVLPKVQMTFKIQLARISLFPSTWMGMNLDWQS